MARDSSGNHTLPSGNPVVGGTTILDTWANPTMSDFSTEITASLNRSGKGGMLAGLKGYAGTVSLPGYAFSTETSSGIYLSATNEVAMSIAGVQLMHYTTGVVNIRSVNAGTALGPILKLHRNSSSPADADFIGAIYFDGEDSGGVQTTFASVEAQIDDVTNSTEDGTLLIKTMQAGTLTTAIDISTVMVVTPSATFTGGITSGSNIISDTDSTDSLGSTGVRWLKLWVDTATVGTMTLAGGSITDSSGAITFGNENLTTTGIFTYGTLNDGTTALSSTVAELNILDGKAFLDEDDLGTDSATGIASQQSIKAYIDGGAGGGGSMSSFQLEDDDGTEITISNAKEVKFIGSGITTNWTDTDNGTDGDPYDLTFTVDAAQTVITSIYATDLILGEDAETAIDFGTPNEIDFKADNAARLTLTASALYPVTNNQIDLGTSTLEFKDAFFDGTVTADAFAGPLTGTADTATNITVSANNATDETVYPLFVDGATGAQGAETDTGLTYNPSSGLLTAAAFSGPLTGAVTGNADTATTATNVTASANNATDETVYPTFVDGATGGQGIETDTGLTYNPSSGLLTTAELSATTLDIGGTNITSTATEINQLDALTRGSILYGNASAVTTRLAKGDADQVLTSDGTDIAWQDAGGGGAYSSWLVKTANFTCADGDQLICNHASTAFTITLPSGTTVGRTVTISNIGAATVTVGRNSQPIDSTASDATLLSNRSTQLVYVDSTIGWKELP